jgi:hypothetical protein
MCCIKIGHVCHEFQLESLRETMWIKKKGNVICYS